MSRHFRIVRGRDGLEGIRDEWLGLLERVGETSFNQSFEWYRAYLFHLEAEGAPVFVVLAYQHGELEAIVPLRLRVRFVFGLPVRMVEVPRHAHMNLQEIALDPRMNNTGLLDELTAFVAGDPQLRAAAVDFGRIVDGSPVLALFSDESGLRVDARPDVDCDVLPVLGEEDLSSHVSKNLRGNLRKARNKLASRGHVEFRSTRQPDRLPEFFERFVDVEASGWKGAQGTQSAIRMHDSLLGFYRSLADGFGRTGNCEINLLEVDGAVVAGQFALIAGHTAYLLKIGYDEKFREFAPGNILLAHTLDRLKKEGRLRQLNLVTDAAWHRSWRPLQLKVFRSCCYDNSIAGTCLFLAANLRRRLAALLRAVRDGRLRPLAEPVVPAVRLAGSLRRSIRTKQRV